MVTEEVVTNWGKWGRDDQIGCLNYLGPQQIVASCGLVKQGRVISLGLEIDHKLIPPRPGNPPLLLRTLDGDLPGDVSLRDSTVRMATDFWGTGMHGVTTHIDALSHVGFDGKLYNGVSSETVRNDGALFADIANVTGIVTRGVFFDVAGARGEQIIPARTPISAAELQTLAKAKGIELRSGDAAIIRTGWSVGLRRGDEHGYRNAAGIDLSAARWLAESEVVCVASDNPAVEVVPAVDGYEGNPYQPVHTELLVRRGCYLLEMLDLEELAATGAVECLFVCAPLRLAGSCGSPINPLAII